MGASSKELRRALIWSVVSVALASCSSDATDPMAIPDPEMNTVYDPARVRLAKTGPAGTTATFSITASGGSLPLGSTVTLNACEEGAPCTPTVVWLATGPEQVEVTIREIAATGNVVLDRITVSTEANEGFVINDPIEPEVTIHVYPGNSALVRFKNVAGPPPPPPTGMLSLAKVGPAGTTATFNISSTGGTQPAGSTVTLNACASIASCTPTVVWLPVDASAQSVTITETSSSGGTVLQSIHVVSDLEGTYTLNNPSSSSVTLQAGGNASVFAAFTNVLPPPPPPPGDGSAGCTPGFWKQSQHFQYWTSPYTPSTQFSAVFTNAFPGMTLLQVLSQGGGGLKALGRHTVAALLNGASGDVDYGMTAAQVISAFNAAVASGNYTALHNEFERRNERGCTAKD